MLLGLAWGELGLLLPRLAKSNATGGSAAQRGPRVCGAAYPRPGRRASLHSRVLTMGEDSASGLASLEMGGGRARRMRHDACVFLEGGGVEGREKPVLAELDDREQSQITAIVQTVVLSRCT